MFTIFWWSCCAFHFSTLIGWNGWNWTIELCTSRREAVGIKFPARFKALHWSHGRKEQSQKIVNITNAILLKFLQSSNSSSWQLTTKFTCTSQKRYRKSRRCTDGDTVCVTHLLVSNHVESRQSAGSAPAVLQSSDMKSLSSETSISTKSSNLWLTQDTVIPAPLLYSRFSFAFSKDLFIHHGYFKLI